jgi:putative chitobiose transport system substrate-binding protein
MKNTNRVRRLIICGLLGLMMVGVVSCLKSPGTKQNNSPSSSQSAAIKFWTMQLQPKFTDYIDRAIKEFEAANPNAKVEWVDVPWDAMQSKIQAAMAAKQAPDVVNLNPDFANQLASQNAWLELDGKVQPSEIQGYIPSTWQANSLNGKSFGFPWYLTTNVTIYNQDLLKQAGVMKPPVSFQELAIAAKQIKEKTGKYALFITFVPEDSNDILESLVQMGVKLTDREGKAAFNTPAGKAAFKYWVDLYKQGLLPKEVLTQGHQRGIQLYQSGDTAMLSAGAPFIDSIAKNAPQIAKVSGVSSQISGQTNKKGVAVMNLVIPRTTTQPDLAVKFALFITNAKNQLAFAKASDTLPSQVAAVSNYQQEIAANKDTSAIDRGKSIGAEQLAQADVLIPPMPEIKLLKKAIYENIQAAMLDKKTVDEAIVSAAKEWDSRPK